MISHRLLSSHLSLVICFRQSICLPFSVESMKAKWKNLCDSYKTCLSREREISKSGSGTFKTPTCRYYSQVSFLRGVVTNQQTISNVTLPTLPPESASPSDLARKSSPAPLFTSTSSYEADDFRSTEPSFEVLSRKGNTSVEGKSTSAKCCKRAPSMDPVESFLIGNIQKNAASKRNDDDPDDLFCRSLVATLKRLPQKKTQMARLKIQQLLFDIEYED